MYLRVFADTHARYMNVYVFTITTTITIDMCIGTGGVVEESLEEPCM